ncbi:cobalt-precorrin-6A reductase [Magnetospirillum aberrantis]|uniref:Cobalt-precorrin-6A reductase n=1 Tax=Magnetospirillum aberrantis SpK TaxID=908842 RepID=A0A7C9UTI5_9PROT|nr:cobalt-precorrin-6A reductase [Magnetospirillum aberrantis SpK]
MARTILILGGTSDAHALAGRLAARVGVRVVSSLAGRTGNPRLPSGEVRIGGFGGPESLARYLEETGVDAVVDATHPFAARMGWNAAEACALAGVRLLRLERPAWQPGPGDWWRMVADWPQAVAALGDSRRVLLALGRQELAPFAALTRVWFLIRSVEAPDPMPPFAQAQILLARGPFAEADEIELLRQNGIDTIVCKNSGGPTDGKLAAARALGLRVVMRARPARPDLPTVADPAAAEEWSLRPAD